MKLDTKAAVKLSEQIAKLKVSRNNWSFTQKFMEAGAGERP
jgi:hypothetical protein